MSKRKKSLSHQYNLSLAQIEWAYALSSILQDFTDLTIERQTTVLKKLCGDNVAVDSALDFSMLIRLWTEDSDLSSLLTAWLLNGLSSPESNVQFFECLERFREEDLEHARLEDMESERLMEVESKDFDSQERDDVVSNDSADSNEHDWQPIQDYEGLLILRIFNPHDNTHSYFTLDGSLRTTLYDPSHEEHLLKPWRSTISHHKRVAILSIEWHTNTVDTISHTISGGGTNATQSLETSGTFLENNLIHTGSMTCSGGYTNTLCKDGIDLNTQTLSCDGQLLERWSIRLHTLEGSPTPLQWNVKQTLLQDLLGEGHQGGHITLESNAYLQIVDNINQVIVSSNPTKPAIQMSQCSDEWPTYKRSSHINTWMGATNIDFSKHVVHHEASTEPIFNQTPSLRSQNEIKTHHQGSSTELHGLFFAEMKSKAWQPGQYQRVQLSYENRIASNVEGTLFWNNNWIQLHDNRIIWSHNRETLTINLQKQSETQISVQQNNPIGSDEATIETSMTRSTKRYQISCL